MKRPWTPGPWTLRLEPIDVNWWDNVERMANLTLASKSPDMAELLIELDEIAAVGITSEIYKIFHKIPALLRSLGYDPTMDADPAD